MKKIAIYVCMFFMIGLSFSQSITWEKDLPETTNIQAVSLGDSLNYVLLTDDQGSFILICDSIFNIISSYHYDFRYEDFVVVDDNIYCAFLSSGQSGIHHMDSLGRFQSGRVVASGNTASHLQLVSWGKKLALIDNYDYTFSDSFPRVSVFQIENELTLESIAYMPRSDGSHQYGDVVVSTDNELYLSVLKQLPMNQLQPRFDLDQGFIRIDSLTKFKVAAQLGDTNINWVDVERQSIVPFPSGSITVGQTVRNTDTIVDLFILDKDGEYFSNHIITGFSSLEISNEAVVYFGVGDAQTIYVLLNNTISSYLLAFDLNGQMLSQFKFGGNIFDQLYLNNHNLYLAGGRKLVSIDLLSNDLRCPLITSEDLTVEDENYTSKGYFIDYFDQSSLTNSSLATKVDTNLAMEIKCPIVQLEGELTGCENSEVKLKAINEEAFVWLTEEGDTLSQLDTISIPVKEDGEYTLKGKYGSEVVFQVLISSDPECDIVPIVYEYISPNSDGENDLFIIENLEFFEPAIVNIVNGQNQVIYENTSYDNSWEPTDVDDGVYYYSVVMGSKKFTGQLVIRR